MKNAPVPEFTSLVNFPIHMTSTKQQHQQSSSGINAFMDGHRNCVMCGQLCACSSNSSKKQAVNKSDHKKNNTNNENSRPSSHHGTTTSIIPTQNKGLCTNCDVNVWIVVSSGLQIKWCKGCKNFRPWAAFGEKGLATKCVRCRDRQREKYALQKEEKEKSQLQLSNSSENTNDENSTTVPATNATTNATAKKVAVKKEDQEENIIRTSSTSDDINDDLLQISSSLKSMSTDD